MMLQLFVCTFAAFCVQHTYVFFPVQKTMTEGKEYCERKINLLKSNFDELVEVCY
jgi:hypothetical protein